jgi:hypothetical protein
MLIANKGNTKAPAEKSIKSHTRERVRGNGKRKGNKKTLQINAVEQTWIHRPLFFYVRITSHDIAPHPQEENKKQESGYSGSSHGRIPVYAG